MGNIQQKDCIPSQSLLTRETQIYILSIQGNDERVEIRFVFFFDPSLVE